MSKSKPKTPIGSNDFLYASPLVDVLHRLGFNPRSCILLEDYLWDNPKLDICPDDLASVLMQVLPLETEAEAAERRRRGMILKNTLFDWSKVQVLKAAIVDR